MTHTDSMDYPYWDAEQTELYCTLKVIDISHNSCVLSRKTDPGLPTLTIIIVSLKILHLTSRSHNCFSLAFGYGILYNGYLHELCIDVYLSL